MKIVVQKFGGTSVARAECREKVIERIVEAKKRGTFPVVVISALRYDKCPYSTDALLGLSDVFSHGDCLREKDLLLSCGELIASSLVSMHLSSCGHMARSFAGFQAGIITDDNFSRARIKRIDTAFLKDCIDKDIIPVVAGFQGISEGGDITTLGRGGSDATAVALGYSLKAEEVQFYKEVDGIMTADPYMVSGAKKLDAISYEEIGEMTCCGSRVLEATSVEMAKKLKVPLVVKNTFNPESSGTLIKDTGEKVTFSVPVTAIAHIGNVAQVHIELPLGSNGEKIEEIFESLAGSGISLDFIALNPNDLLFIVDMKLLKKAENILEKLGLSISIVKNCSKISAVGAGMRGVPGVMIRAFSALRREGIKVLCSAGSHITIAFLVHGRDEKKAIAALHKEFIGS